LACTIPGLVLVYSIKLHNVLNHIWQSYINADGMTVQLSTQAYYSTFLNVICSFYNLKEYPINLAEIFQDTKELPLTLPTLWANSGEGCNHSV
jgi:hypothetical protein